MRIEKRTVTALSNRSVLVHYGIALSGAVTIGIGLGLAWVLHVDWAGWLVLAGATASMVFALRTWYLGSRGADLTPRRR